MRAVVSCMASSYTSVSRDPKLVPATEKCQGAVIWNLVKELVDC